MSVKVLFIVTVVAYLSKKLGDNFPWKKMPDIFWLFSIQLKVALKMIFSGDSSR